MRPEASRRFHSVTEARSGHRKSERGRGKQTGRVCLPRPLRLALRLPSRPVKSHEARALLSHVRLFGLLVFQWLASDAAAQHRTEGHILSIELKKPTLISRKSGPSQLAWRVASCRIPNRRGAMRQPYNHLLSRTFRSRPVINLWEL